MRSTDDGPFPSADRAPAAYNGSLYELEAIRRTLDDLSPAERRRPPTDVRFKLEWSAAAVAALAAFLGWLLLAR